MLASEKQHDSFQYVKSLIKLFLASPPTPRPPPLPRCLPMQKMRVQFLDCEDPLEREMATHSSILAWEIPQTEEPGGPQSMGLQRAGHDLMTKSAPPAFLQKF